MGKIIATYLVRVTLREPDDLTEPDSLTPLTNDELAAVIQEALGDHFEADPSVTSERTDI